MFDLEPAIADWREQMLAAGISASGLDELECHLREEITSQMKQGMNASGAFRAATALLGKSSELKTEFRKNRQPLEGFTFRRFATIPGFLAILWFVSCAHDLVITASWWYVSPHWVPHFNLPLGLMSILTNGAGCAGGLLIFTGSKLGVRILRSVALLYLIICLAQCAPNLGQPTGWRIWCGCFAAFSFLTIWLLHRTTKQTAIA